MPRNDLLRALALLIFTNLMIWQPQPSVVADSQRDDQILEDQLNADKIRWAGQGLPVNQVTNVIDSLTSQPVGIVIIDQTTISRAAPGTPIVVNLFSTETPPRPGESRVVSVWGSKLEGCFVEVYVQQAPDGNQLDELAITPTLLELGVNGQLLQLPPNKNAAQRFSRKEYTYPGPYSTMGQGIWYSTRTIFSIDANIAKILANANAVDTRARLTLANGQTVVIRLEKTTAAGWRQAYGFNPSCESPRVAQQRQALGARPLVNAFKLYRDSEAQRMALQWLQSQVPRDTLLEFSRRWRGRTTPQANQVNLIEAARIYKDLRGLNESLDWLQQNIKPELLEEFIRKWA
jgi:hypothetical protein